MNSSITFEIEQLERAKDLIETIPYKSCLERLILAEYKFYKSEISKDFEQYFNIVAHNKYGGKLVSYDFHAFFNGMHKAYAEHRPFVLSPDMIWLLISQAFARHVNINSEKLRKHFVDYKGHVSLVVRDDRINIDNPESPWEEVFPEFTKKN